MRLEAASSLVPRLKTVFRTANASAGGWMEVNPAFSTRFAELGIDTPTAFLDLRGEVVSGHPDRHVLRVCLPGFANAFYLKRQHSVSRREKWRNWIAGFGWVSRSEREAAILKRLSTVGLPCPRWAAAGVDGRGRAFLLVEEIAGSVDLRRFLSDTRLSHADRAAFAVQLGRMIEMVHIAGFTTPELTAKHVLIAPGSMEIALIDWQSARRVRFVSLQDRLRSLASLHASLAETLASPQERLRVMWNALQSDRDEGLITGRFSELVRQVQAEAARLADRRSIRDQRQSLAENSQRLVWVAGEAVCAVPDVAALWPEPAIGPPYYGGEPGTFIIQLPDGRQATLTRGSSFAPLGRLRARLSGKPWRSPGVTMGRLLFHLERYGIPAPRLLAFGQRLTGAATADWFALHTPIAETITQPSSAAIAAQLGRCLRQLHDAGCSTGANPLAIFGADVRGVAIRDLKPIRIAKPEAKIELSRLLAALSPWVRGAAEAGYRSEAVFTPKETRNPGKNTVNRLTGIEIAQ